MHFTTKYLAILATVALLVAQPGRAAQQSKADQDADQKELYAYVLNEEKLHKLSDTTRDMKEWEKKHPEAEKEKSDRSLEEGTIAERAKAIEAKVPEVGAIVRKNGLTLHEYIVAFYVLMQASILVSMKKSSNKDYTKEETALVSPANLAFVEQHWDELQKMNQDPADKNKPSDKENE